MGLRRGEGGVTTENKSTAEVVWFEIKNLTHITRELGSDKEKGP